MTSVVALIPARAGSQRVPGKNTRSLAGHPLLAYAIAAAQEAGIFDPIIVSSEDEATGQIARRYGAEWIERPAEYARPDSPDIEWVNHFFRTFPDFPADAFCILRPTSPFRRGPWIRAAWEAFRDHRQNPDSLRAMRPVREHPGKMWLPSGELAVSLMSGTVWVSELNRVPFHSMPTQDLPPVWVQTAALEIAWTRVLPHSIAGESVLPWVAESWAPEAIDINTESDWSQAERYAGTCTDWLPPVRIVGDSLAMRGR